MGKEELIILFLGNNGKKYTKRQVERYVGRNIDTELKKLELEAKIYIDKDNFISSFPTHLEIGRILIQNDRPILIKGNKRYAISKENLKGARHNDLVVIKKTNIVVPHNKTEYHIAKVEKILKRGSNNIIVEVKGKDNGLYVDAINDYLDGKIIIHNSKLKSYSLGDRLLIEVSEPDSKNNYQGIIVEFIGHKDDPDLEINTLLIKNGFSRTLSEKSQKELEQIPDHVRDQDRIGRTDLTKILTISIDGKTAKDRDDAVSLKILPNGNYLFMGHISDVPYYIHPGMHLWNEVLYRGSSCYPLNLVVHMINEHIATGICSLNEGVDRLTVTTFIEVDPKGNIVNYYKKRTIINSHKACTYEKVNEILDEHKIVPGYEDIEDTLKLFKQFTDLMLNKMIKNGMLDFNSSDTVIERDIQGKIHKIINKKMGSGEKIIEVLMLLIDMSSAQMAYLPRVWRNHEGPDNLDELCEILRKTVKSIKIPKRITSKKQLQQLIEDLKGKPEEEFATRIIIQHLKRAYYSGNNMGHYGLGIEGDTQDTSPMRRGGDLHNVYCETEEIEGKEYTKEELDELFKKAQQLSKRLNEVELASERVELGAKKIAMRDYLRQNRKPTYNGTITYLSNKLVLVRTEDGVEGSLDLNGLYTFDKATNTLKHKHNKYRLALGNAVALVPKKQEPELVFALKK